MKNNQQILVGIYCITYNHKDYLRQCLDGFVMQQTNFRFVAVVHDDCSTDGTTDILREYAEKYPGIVHPIYEEENQYSKHNGEIGRKMNEAFNQLGVKYIAMCEGDDYWTDPLKLQKQVDFMESHPECTCHAHNSLTLNTQTREIGLFNKKLLKTQDYSLETFLTKDWFTPTQSLLYRNSAYSIYDNAPTFMHGDYYFLINVLINPNSYLHYENEIMAVYRNGGWASTHLRELDLYDDFIALLAYFKGKSNHRCDSVFDKQIQRHQAEKNEAMRHQALIKKSRSVYVRIGHWLCRKIARLTNRYVECIHVEKKVIRQQLPNIEQLD